MTSQEGKQKGKRIKRVSVGVEKWVDEFFTPAIHFHWEPWLYSLNLSIFFWLIKVEVELSSSAVTENV